MKVSPEKAGFDLTDQAGRRVHLAGVSRLVSLAPSNTELVYALGAENYLCGVTEYCDYPPQARLKPKVGGYSTVSIEAVRKAEPDLVLAATIHLKEVVPLLAGLGYPVLVLEAGTIPGMLKAIALAGRVTGREAQAKELVSSLQKRVAMVTSRVDTLPPDKRPKVFYLHESQTWKTFGTKTIGDALTEMAGGYNIGRDFGDYYPYPSLDSIAKANPDIIIAETGYGADPGEPLRIAQTEPALATTAARRTGRVYGLASDLISRAGPRLVDGLEALARIIHPELFEGNIGPS